MLHDIIRIGDKSYHIVEDTEFTFQHPETTEDYAKRISKLYEQATHWLCTESKGCVKQGKLYDIHKIEDEYVIKGDDGIVTLIWLVSKGTLLIEDKHVYCTDCVDGIQLITSICDESEMTPLNCFKCYPYNPEDSVNLSQRTQYKERTRCTT